MKHVRERIRRYRLIRGYSQEYVAFRLGVSQSTFARLEGNNIKLSLDRLYKIAEILEVSSSELQASFEHKPELNRIGPNQ